MDFSGYGYAILALVFFGLYMVPRRLSMLRDLPFVLSMCTGVVITSLLLLWFLAEGNPEPLPRTTRLLAFICGLIWYAGVLFYTISVSHMGLTIATPIKNTTAVLGTLAGLYWFAEWRETYPLPAIAGSLLVVLCAVLLSRTGEADCERGCVTPRGVFAAIAAAFFFAAYTIPFKTAQEMGFDSIRLVTWMGLGTFVAAVIVFAVLDRRWSRWAAEPAIAHFWAALSGGIWVLAVLAMAESINRIGLAVTWPLTNLNTVVTVICGIVFFHEVNVRTRRGPLVWGLLAGIVGVVLLGLARH